MWGQAGKVTVGVGGIGAAEKGEIKEAKSTHPEVWQQWARQRERSVHPGLAN